MEPIVLTDYPYEVDSDGNVFRMERKGKRDRTLHRLKITPHRLTNGYLMVKLYNPKANCYKKWYLHRLVYTAFYGDIPKGYEISHVDCDRTNCKLENLVLSTHAANCRNPRSLEHYRAANSLSAGKFNREKMQEAKSPERYKVIVNIYQHLNKIHGKVGIWMLMKSAHCNYYRAKRIIEEQEGKNDVN